MSLLLFGLLSACYKHLTYRPSAPFLYEVASHVKKTAIPAIIIHVFRGVTFDLNMERTIMYYFCPSPRLAGYLNGRSTAKSDR